MWAIYGLLCLSAFVSATLLPGSSEAVLLGLLAKGQGAPLILIAVASVGNIAGALVNWLMGRSVLLLKEKPWFPLKDATHHRAQAWFARYGVWSLLLSWVPVVGDPLTLIAGIMRVPFWTFLFLVGTGKVLRYCLILMAWTFWAQS
jgi:membrane protein YqaA with SNARE-associated domain